MRNLSIKTRLVGVMFLLSLLLVLLGAGALFSLSRTNSSLKTVYEDRLLALAYLDAVATNMLTIQVEAGAMLEADAAGVERQLDKVKSLRGVADKAWSDYKATELTDEETRLADEFVRARRAAAEEGVDPYVAALKAGDKEKAIGLLHDKVDPAIRDAMRAMGALIKLQQDVGAEEYRQSQQRYASFFVSASGAIVLGVLMAAGMGWWLVAAITRPLARAVSIAESVAAGDLTRQITVDSSDEMGQMTAALKRMNDSLATIVGNVRGGTETISVAAGEIAQGNADLSSRTEAQASALEETASSMEELTGTVRQNAENARSANGLALAASEVAQRGGDVVTQVVERMGAISAASARIADIIGVIDGIAFQTNILALNAAVEAARAGEQGRGFAVVATEVRNLAHRSAAAAKEVKALIDDSVEQVDAGGKLVGEAGATMKEVVASVRRVTDIMGEIMAASAEQNAGIGQINDAVVEMDSATQQNAALVEQAAAAAAAMREQAAQLAAAVAVFKVAGNEAARLAPAKHANVPGRAALPARAKARVAGKPVAAQLDAADGWEQF